METGGFGFASGLFKLIRNLESQVRHGRCLRTIPSEVLYWKRMFQWQWTSSLALEIFTECVSSHKYSCGPLCLWVACQVVFLCPPHWSSAATIVPCLRRLYKEKASNCWWGRQVRKELGNCTHQWKTNDDTNTQALSTWSLLQVKEERQQRKEERSREEDRREGGN